MKMKVWLETNDEQCNKDGFTVRGNPSMSESVQRKLWYIFYGSMHLFFLALLANYSSWADGMWS